MSFLQGLFGNNTEIGRAEAQAALAEILIDGEQVECAFKSIRDLIVLTNYRLLSVDKQGITGTKQETTSIPFGSIRKFSATTAGGLDGDAELKVWVSGESQPSKWEFARRTVDINKLGRDLARYLLTKTHEVSGTAALQPYEDSFEKWRREQAEAGK